MRTLMRCAVAVVVLAALPSCSPIGGCGQPKLASLEEQAAARATSCPYGVRWGGHLYAPWCAQVDPSLRGEPFAHADDVNDRFTASAIDGVPRSTALALRARTHEGDFGRRCGRWRFAPAFGLDPSTAREIARRVTVAPDDVV